MIFQSFRYWLADKLTGGALTWSKISAQIDEEQRVMWRDRAFARMTEIGRLTAALRTIAAMPTPKANATVRRMARVAHEAVK